MKKIITTLPLLFSIIFCKAQIGTVTDGDSTNFEVNASFASIDAITGNIWQIGTPQKTFFGTSHSAPYAIMTDSVNPYPVNNLSSFTVEYHRPGSSALMNTFLGFWHKYETDSLKDGGYVEVSIDSGATWQNVVLETSGNPAPSPPVNFYSTADTIYGNIPAFSGTQSIWKYSEFGFQWLIPVSHPSGPGLRSGDTVFYQIKFRFNFKSDSVQTNKAGWIIDNVRIVEKDLGGGIHENELANFDVQVYPNPVNEQGIIQVVPKNNEHDYTIRIYTPQGQLVSSAKMDRNDQYIIKANEMKSGMYFYSVFSKSGGIKNGKIVIK